MEQYAGLLAHVAKNLAFVKSISLVFLIMGIERVSQISEMLNG